MTQDTPKIEAANPTVRRAVGPTILLSSGQYFDYEDAESSLFDIGDIARGLSHICRFAGQSSRFYSVAEHSVYVSQIVPPEHAFAALMHDAVEAFVGDTAKPLKIMCPDYQAIEKRIERAVLDRFGLSLPLAPCIKEADIVMLATEQAQIMKNRDDWEYTRGRAVADISIQCLTPDAAFNLFLDRFDELYPIASGIERKPTPAQAESAGEGEACTICGMANRNHFDHLAPFGDGYHKYSPSPTALGDVEPDWDRIIIEVMDMPEDDLMKLVTAEDIEIVKSTLASAIEKAVIGRKSMRRLGGENHLPDVSEDDRRAAWLHRPNCYQEADFGNWMAGLYDNIKVIQSFREHRHIGARAAIAASGGNEGEVVAWLYERAELGQYKLGKARDLDHVWMVENGYTETPLYAHPAKAQPSQSEEVRQSNGHWRTKDGLPNGERVEVRERDGKSTFMIVGSGQWNAAVRDLGPNMAVRLASQKEGQS